MLKKIIGIVVGVCFCSAQAIAETRVEEAKRLDNLAISAIDCALLSDDGSGRGITDAEGQRLADIGLTAGRRFLELVANLSIAEKRSVAPEGKIAWGAIGGVSGPSIDFVLGRMWQEREEILYRIEFDVHGDDAKWKRDRVRLYSERNCMLIR